MTEQLYLEDSYTYQLPATIVASSQDERGYYIILDQTIFYPQGGGQPSDYGKIRCDEFELEVTHVRQIGDEIRHYITSKIDAILAGREIICIVDQERRMLNARYHTAGHFLGNVVESIYPSLKAVKGHSFPKEAYVGFNGPIEKIEQTVILDALQEAVKSELVIKAFKIEPLAFANEFYELPYSVPDNKEFRVVRIGSYPPIPCGGTHLANTKEIGNIELSKIKIKNDVVNISYELP